MAVNERNFIKRLKNGKEDALEYVIDRYLPIVKSIVQNVLRPIQQEELVDECVNDIFLSAWQNAKKFRGRDENEFKNWLCAVAKYRAIDHYRKEVKRNEVPVEFLETFPTPAGTPIHLKDEVEEILNQLEPIDRKIFMMRYLLGYNSTEISKSLGMTKSAIDNRMYRGRKQLRKNGRLLYEQGHL